MKGYVIISLLFSSCWFTLLKSEFHTFSIIHFNDFHARYWPITNFGGPCKDTNCIGGFSRLYSQINKLVKTSPNPIVLNAGDNFIGTLWYQTYRWNITQHFMNKLPLDAITIGNHEFDDGLNNLKDYLKRLNAPVVCTNIDASQEPEFAQYFNKSVVIQKGGKKIGVIGVILKETKHLSNTGNLLFLNESASVNAEATQLLNKEKVFTNIVLSHCGYQSDIEIAKYSTSKISVVVGGHTDTFLYTGTPIPGPDKPLGPYPTIVTNIHSGNKVLVVQASAYSKYLGNLTVIYDDDGNLREWFGNPIFLNQEIAEDETINQEILLWKRDVDIAGSKVVGKTLKAMPNKPCRSSECLLGNFVTDAMVHSSAMICGNASIAMIHAGGMRSGLKVGDITQLDLSSTFPFQDTIDCYEFKGREIQEILETAVNKNSTTEFHLYQLSGIHVVYNTSKPKGQRVVSLKMRCQNCNSPMLENVNFETNYKVLLPGFLTKTQFNPLFSKYMKHKRNGLLDINVYTLYLQEKSLINPKLEGRIKIVH